MRNKRCEPISARQQAGRRATGLLRVGLVAAAVLGQVAGAQAADDVQVATGRFALTAGTGNQSITGVGFRPKAYILIYTKNAADDADSIGIGSLLSIGMTDGATQFCMASGSEHNVSGSDVGRRGFSDAVIATHDAQGSQTVEGEASHVSMDANGFTINKTVAFTAPASPFVQYIAFGGCALTAHVDTVDLNNTQDASVDETAPGFEPDVVITSYIGVLLDADADATNDVHSFSLGWSVNPDRQASNNQYSMTVASRDGVNPTQTRSRFDNVRAGTSIRDDATDAAFEIGSFDASGFSVTTRLTAATTNEIMGYLALNLGSNPKVYTVARTARTSTGNDTESGSGFQPVFLLGVGGAVVTSANTNVNGSSMAIGMTDGASTFAVEQHDQDNVATTNTHTRVTNTQFLSANTGAGTIDWEATFTSFNSGGWTINYGNAAGAAYQNAFLAIGSTPATGDITSGTAGFWKFNDASGANATDSSGNGNDGVLTGGAAWSTGMFAGAIALDGAGDYVNVPPDAALNIVGDATITGWFRLDADFDSSDTTTQIIFEKYSSIDFNLVIALVGTDYNSAIPADGSIVFKLENGAGGNTYRYQSTSTTSWEGGVWYHFAVTIDSSDATNNSIYINGVDDTNGTGTGGSGGNAIDMSFNADLNIGGKDADTGQLATSRYFDGRMDDVRIYDRVLSDCEASVLAKGYGLVGHWKLDNLSGGSTTDSAGVNNGSVTGAVATSGKLCDALDFDGAGDYVSITNASELQLTSALSITAWVRLQTFGTGTDADSILRKGDANPNNYQLAIADSKVSLILDGNDNGGYVGNTTLSADTWYHVAGTWNGSFVRIYVNGVLNNTPAARSTAIATDTRALYIGGRIGGDESDGIVDDVRLYNRALTAAEVQALAATYTVIDLGTLTGEPTAGADINDNEEVVGFDENTTTGDTAGWFSEFCLLTGIGTLGGGSISEAHGINNSSVVCGLSDNGANLRAVTWTSGGGLTNLGVLAGRDASEALAINADNEVVGSSFDADAQPDNWLAFIYLPVGAYTLPAGLNSLGTLGGGDSVARDINDSGIVVGGAQQADGDMRPFRWSNGTMTDLGSLGGESSSILHRAEAVNANDEIVGISYTAGGAPRAFLYLPSGAYGLSMGMNNLGTLSSGDQSFAFDINDDGQVVGTSNLAAAGTTYHAFIWQNGTMTDLNNLIDSNSGWTLTRATGINDDGEIVGWGTNSDGVIRAFVLVQSCATGAVTQARISTVALADTAYATGGQASVSIVNDEDVELAHVAVEAMATAGRLDAEVIEVVPADLPDSTIDDPRERMLARRVVVEADAPSDAFLMTVTMLIAREALLDADLSPAQLRVVPVAQSPFAATAAQLTATDDVGEGDPARALVGQNGYVINDDGTVELWLVTDHTGTFALKIRETPADNPPDNEPPRVVPQPCGVGTVTAVVFSMFGLTPMLFRRRGRNPRVE